MQAQSAAAAAEASALESSKHARLSHTIAALAAAQAAAQSFNMVRSPPIPLHARTSECSKKSASKRLDMYHFCVYTLGAN